MADLALIITSAIFLVLIVISSIYFLVYFQHPEDKWVAWFPKLVVVLGLSLACSNVLLLPLDVANSRGDGGLPMALLNVIFYVTSVGMVLIVIPFTVFYYEGSDARDGKSNMGQQIFNAFKWCTPLLFVVLIVLVPTYIFLAVAEVKVSYLTSPMILMENITTTTRLCTEASCRTQDFVDEIHVSFVVYVIALTSFVGWALFSVFGGVGLFSLPVDIFLDFKHRPKPISKAEYAEKKLVIGEVAAALMKDAETLQTNSKTLGASKNSRFSRKAASHRNKEVQFRRDVFLLEQSYQKLEEAYRRAGQNPILVIFKLLVGVIGFCLSTLWLVHICAYFIPYYLGAVPLTFLSDMFSGIADVQLIGPLLFGLFAFWLLMCVIKGAIKFGMRILFVTVHPMKMGETMMGSLVFNTGMILICSLPVAQFCTLAFPSYSRDTQIAGLFQTQVQNLKNLNVGFSVFIFIFLGVSLLTMIWLRLQRHDSETAKKLKI